MPSGAQPHYQRRASRRGRLPDHWPVITIVNISRRPIDATNSPSALSCRTRRRRPAAAAPPAPPHRPPRAGPGTRSSGWTPNVLSTSPQRSPSPTAMVFVAPKSVQTSSPRFRAALAAHAAHAGMATGRRLHSAEMPRRCGPAPTTPLHARHRGEHSPGHRNAIRSPHQRARDRHGQSQNTRPGALTRTHFSKSDATRRCQ